MRNPQWGNLSVLLFATFFRLQSTSVETDREGLAPDSMPTFYRKTKRRTLNNYHFIYSYGWTGLVKKQLRAATSKKVKNFHWISSVLCDSVVRGFGICIYHHHQNLKKVYCEFRAQKSRGHKIDSFACCSDQTRQNFQNWDLHGSCTIFCLSIICILQKANSNWGWSFSRELLWASAWYKMFGTIHRGDHFSELSQLKYSFQ